MATQEWVCIGKRMTTKNTLANFFLTPDDGEKGYSKPKNVMLKTARPGSVLAVTVEDGLLHDIKFLRTEHSERVDEWIAESEAVEAEFERDRLAKREGTEQTIKRMVEPIRVVYQSCITPAQRRAVLMSVMEAITR